MNDIIELEDGYYFYDEAQLEVGPFKTELLAQKALDAYVKWMNHDHQENSIKKMKGNYD